MITCKSISSKIQSSMLLTFQDRLRIPWRGGAKQVRFQKSHLLTGSKLTEIICFSLSLSQISLEAIIPMILLPLSLFVAALNVYCCIVICLAIPLCLGYCYYYLRKVYPRWFVICVALEAPVLTTYYPLQNEIFLLVVVLVSCVFMDPIWIHRAINGTFTRRECRTRYDDRGGHILFL